MIHFNYDEMQTVEHAAEVLRDRLACEPDEYTETDSRAVDNLRRMGDTDGCVLVLTGDELSSMDESRLMRRIVAAELGHWVPNASQRLLYRAARALNNFGATRYVAERPDCGPQPGQHCLTPDYVEGIYVLRCTTCSHLFRR